MLLYVRHGESQANVDFVFAGQRDDSPLTELGQQQARATGEEILNKGIRIDKIISSPLVRASLTAEIIAGIINYPIEDIAIDARISEYDMGEMSGKSRKSVTREQFMSAKDSENVYDFRDRILDFVKEYTKDENVNILFATHAGVGRMLHAVKEGVDPENFYEVKAYPNAHVTEIKL